MPGRVNRDGNMSVSNDGRISQGLKYSANKAKSIAATVRVLDCPDVRIESEDMSEGQVLSWDNSTQKFTNTTIQTIAPNAITVPVVREIFVKNGGDNGQAEARSSADAVADFDVGLNLMSEFANSYEQLQLWVSGDVNWNTNLAGRFREGSLVGNAERGISIRGLSSATSLFQLADGASPRNDIFSQLTNGGALNGVFSNDSNLAGNLRNATFKLNAWISSADIGGYFIRNESGGGTTETVTFPIMVDGTTIDGITANRRIFLATSNSNNPVVGQNYSKRGFPSKITCNNNGDTANVGFTMDGNVQLQDVHIELQDGVKTPFNINGEFQIMYCLFSNTTVDGGSVTATTLSLSSSGTSRDALAYAGAVPSGGNLVGAVEGQRVIKVSKSVFQDLIIKVDSPCEFTDCVFNRCHIENPRGAKFTSCTFYNNRGIVVGDSTKSDYLGNSMVVDKSYFIYGKNIAQVVASNNALLSVTNSIWRPKQVGGGNQSNPIITLNSESHCNLEKLMFPTTSGIVTSGTALNGSVLESNNSTVVATDLTLFGDSNSASLLLAKESNVVLKMNAGQTFWNGCDNTAPLITAFTSNVLFNGFNPVFTGTFSVATATLGLLNLHNCDVVTDNVFGVSMNASDTTLNILYLENSNLSNSNNGDSTTQFNLIANVAKNTMHLINSNVKLKTGAIANDQSTWVGVAILENNSSLNVLAHSAGSWSAGDNLSWSADNASHSYILTVSGNSSVSLSNMNLDPITVSGANKTKSVSLDRGSSFKGYHTKIDVLGQTGESALSITNDSHAHFTDSTFRTRVSNGNPAVLVDMGSSLKFINIDTPQVSRALECGHTDIDGVSNAITVSNGSLLHLSAMSVTTTGSKGIVLSDMSSLVCKGNASTIVDIDVTESSAATDACVEADNLCDVLCERVQAKGKSITTPSFLIMKGNCRGVLKDITKDGNIGDESIHLYNGSKLHMSGTNSVAVQLKLGNTGSNTFNYSALTSTPFQLPGLAFISDGNGHTRRDTEGVLVTHPAA